jgi:hypothetical protein
MEWHEMGWFGWSNDPTPYCQHTVNNSHLLKLLHFYIYNYYEHLQQQHKEGKLHIFYLFGSSSVKTKLVPEPGITLFYRLLDLQLAAATAVFLLSPFSCPCEAFS